MLPHALSFLFCFKAVSLLSLIGLPSPAHSNFVPAGCAGAILWPQIGSTGFHRMNGASILMNGSADLGGPMPFQPFQPLARLGAGSMPLPPRPRKTVSPVAKNVVRTH